LCILALSPQGHAHSWVERAYVLSGDTIVGEPGFPRGNVLRTSPSFTDETMTYLLPPNNRNPSEILPSDPICKETQRTNNQTAGSPMLLARASDKVLLMYQENGHVTKLTDGQNSGFISVYGTSTPSPTDTLQDIHGVWSFEQWRESGGKNGMIYLGGFDNGHCYQDNGSPEASKRKTLNQRQHLDVEGNDLWCGRRLFLPKGLTPGSIYTLYWVWPFVGAVGKKEIYTTCLDI
ncbi:hypothetical protein K469DRAFT_513192, partial [Zopfia rhizophila CBS 207.26]